ncbi:MAG TPA: hypothetical protein VFS43_30200 [Polyangiaceae bacterium]|nr:hypothetical protein [Polyangiaceae bacterium]
MRARSNKTEPPRERFVGWLGLACGKLCAWKGRYGRANERSALARHDDEPWWPMVRRGYREVLTLRSG